MRVVTDQIGRGSCAFPQKKKKSVASTAARCKRGDRHRQKARQALALRPRHLCVREPPAFFTAKKTPDRVL
jgi:hypothetical protein